MAEETVSQQREMLILEKLGCRRNAMPNASGSLVRPHEHDARLELQRSHEKLSG
ncbi:hypothetical protein ACPOL_6497 [Acidisarcina polymorpha]|uniref:Uncharacterized protein n=1 Tax=Acidisarcina polymorpha TaxID=2211140 RepID=A0A2Z5G8Z4_9BACT|nr:hypothetical protein [Acidisarcina polymorpha]AXC15723.1 hypothetical protein ACPOL_6497 [Acidisarcina polymorpha]